VPAVPLLLFCVTLCERACPSLRSSPGVCLACAHGFGVRRLLFLVGAVAAVMWVGGAPRSGALGWAGRLRRDVARCECCDTMSHVVSVLVKEVWLMPET